MKSRLAVTGVVLLVTSALLACGEAPSAPVAAPTPVVWAQDAQREALEGRIAQLEAQASRSQGVAETPSAPTAIPTPVLSGALGPLGAQDVQIEALEARITELEERIDRLEGQITRMEAERLRNQPPGPVPPR